MVSSVSVFRRLANEVSALVIASRSSRGTLSDPISSLAARAKRLHRNQFQEQGERPAASRRSLSAWDSAPVTGAGGRLADLRQELRCLLSLRDPACVCDKSPGFQPDENHCVIGPLLPRLAHACSGMVPGARNQL